MDEDPWACWLFDQAVHHWGNWLEYKTSLTNEHTGKPKFKLETLLRDVIKNPSLQLLKKTTSTEESVMRGVDIG